jgi:hypothetical protein
MHLLCGVVSVVQVTLPAALLTERVVQVDMRSALRATRNQWIPLRSQTLDFAIRENEFTRG